MTKIGIYNHADGSQEVRDMTINEKYDYEKTISDIVKIDEENKKKQEEAENALLSSLGITREQAITLKLIQPEYVPPIR